MLDMKILKQQFDAAVVSLDGVVYVRSNEGWWGRRSADGSIAEIAGHDLTRRLEMAWRRHRLEETFSDLTDDDFFVGADVPAEVVK